jgi:hypothetical protein
VARVLDLGMSCVERAWSTAAGVAGAKPAVRIGLPRTVQGTKPVPRRRCGRVKACTLLPGAITT